MSETETRERLTDEERETLYAPGRRIDAYYYSFDPTGAPAIDAILSAVAHAGKGYHHTEDWSDAGDEDFPGRWGAGRSCIDVIQAAANEAAESVAELSRLRGVVEAVQALADEPGSGFPYVRQAALRAALAPVSSSGEARHTRTSTGGFGPDYCAGCSEAAQEWVKWPCPSSSGGQADGEGEGLTEAEKIVARLDTYTQEQHAAGIAAARRRAARPVLSREALDEIATVLRDARSASIDPGLARAWGRARTRALDAVLDVLAGGEQP